MSRSKSTQGLQQMFGQPSRTNKRGESFGMSFLMDNAACHLSSHTIHRCKASCVRSGSTAIPNGWICPPYDGRSSSVLPGTELPSIVRRTKSTSITKQTVHANRSSGYQTNADVNDYDDTYANGPTSWASDAGVPTTTTTTSFTATTTTKYGATSRPRPLRSVYPTTIYTEFRTMVFRH